MNKFFVVAFIALFLFSCEKSKGKVSVSLNSDFVEVPMQGNTYTTEGTDIVNLYDGSLGSWNNSSTVLSTYFRVANSGTMKLGLKYSATATGKIKVSCEGKSFDVSLVQGIDHTILVGEIDGIQAGYVRVDLQGLERSGSTYGAISAIMVGGLPGTEDFTYVNNADYHYWGRRGPSVHMKYTLPEEDIEWFYNEVTVPEGSDPVGSYYMANGFAEGYFGIQVNSATERRILFSVWSPFVTDKPEEIPENEQVLLNKKGSTVTSQAFGGEGSGRQNFMIFPWKAGVTYGFLTHIRPDPARSGYTEYTCYFHDPLVGDWMLIASNSRPKTTTYYKSPHSFLENFDPAYGYLQRKVFFGNMWARSNAGTWTGLTNGTFTFDGTAKAKQRMDHKGGVEDNRFFLQNCGFFSDYTDAHSSFTRTATGSAPVIDFDHLP